MNYLKALKRKFRKQRDNFIAQFEFKPARELPFTIEEIADAVESNRIIHLEFNGRKQFPTFQFDGQGSVYPALKEHLPRLLSSDWNAWEVCFWLYREHAVVLKQLKPNASQLEGVANIDEVLRISERAAELTETCVARPIDLAISGNNEALSAFVDSWLAPDRRDIPEPAVPKNFWESFSVSRAASQKMTQRAGLCQKYK